MLEASKLTRTSGDTTLLDNISISVAARNRIALIGPSGSGKTVLLRSLAMLDPLDQDSLRWHGEKVADADVPSYRSRVMYLHQQPAAKEGTVESVLQEPFQLHAHKEKTYSRTNMIELLHALGKQESYLDQQHLDLSGGESQIAALIRAVQLEPNILLLDEPTSALDEATTQQVETFLLDWVQTATDRAFIWVTHDPEQANRISDRTMRIADGQLEET